MKVLLINPPENFGANYGKLEDSVDLVEPLNLLCLAAYLTRDNHEVRILDAFVRNLAVSEIVQEVDNIQPELIGITATTPLAPNMYELSRVLKSKYPDVPIVFGGIHATALPDDCFNKGCPDYVVRGEGEYKLSALLRHLDENGHGSLCNIAGISYRISDKIIHNRDDDSVVNINEIPLLDWSLLPMSLYRPKPDLIIRAPVNTLMSTRGCPHRCKYCSNNASKTPYREMNLGLLFDHIDVLMKKYGTRQIRFVDDNFTLRKTRVLDFCNQFIERGYAKKLIWSCSSRVDGIDKDLLSSMKAAGCRVIYFGIETGNQELLDSMQKRTTVKKAREAIMNMKEVGIESRCSFMLGMPGETKEMTEKTISFAIQLNPTYATFLMTTPYPGTELYENVKDSITSFQWERFITVSGFSNFDPVYVPACRTPVEMKNYQKQAFKKFYNRPSKILDQVTSIRSVTQLKRKIRVFLSLMLQNRN